MKKLLVLLLVGLLVGCGARGEVAKEKLLARIDSLLGEMDVKRKEISLSVTALKDGIDGLRRAKIKAQVKQDQIKRLGTPLEEKRNSIDTTLIQLRDYLASGEAVEIGGKTYSPSELTAMADKVLAARKEIVIQIESFEKSQANLQQGIDSLDRSQRD